MLALVCACGEPHVAVGVSTSGPFLAAARMAFRDAVASGSVAGLDNDAASALQKADSLVSVPGMVAVGHSNSQSSLAAAPVYNQHGIVELSPTSSASAFAEAGSF